MLTPHESNEFFANAFAECPAMAILRGFTVERATTVAQRAWANGFKLVEIPLQNEAAADTIQSLARTETGVLGAGTITSLPLAEHAARVGARFTVAPGYDEQVAFRSLELGMPHLPGVASATEVQAAMAKGFTWLKAFPANLLGPEWIQAMHGPFPGAKFVATGGISNHSFEPFLSAGAAGVSFGAAIESLDEHAMGRLR